MSSYVGVLVLDQWFQSQFTQVELRSLQSKFVLSRNHNGKVTIGDLPPLMAKLKAFSTMFTEEDIKGILAESYANTSEEIDFEAFLRVIHYMYMLQYYLICILSSLIRLME